MEISTAPKRRKCSAIRKWIHRAFLVWATVSTLWLANSVRTQGVDRKELRNSVGVQVVDQTQTLEFLPAKANCKTALVFFCGSGIAAEAYAPLLRPVAEDGYAVFIIKLPYRFAPLDSHKKSAVDTAISLISSNPKYECWVLSGHSLGAALACRTILASPAGFDALVLIGTTHPKVDDLSFLQIPVTKVYGSNDGIATPESTLNNKGLLPRHTRRINIQGGNHSQFGHYGHQLFDGRAGISRLEQQRETRRELLKMLSEVDVAYFEQKHALEPETVR